MRNTFRRFLTDESASTSLEYAVIASLVSIAIIGATMSIGNNLSSLYFGKLVAGFTP